ncbi:hypothetical protein CIRMBP1277_01034 [Enterococcus cecorum]|nr:hypothetical protein CIRMBP1277_01034 [Enterococcus cecorum]CAI3391980.1 hypothetical protein CIRMBP1253_01589 [Enterococcus cecorum]CAI3420844.1 hypothetical protein CIRMBP1275_01640 [Enterococcus cecorum]
MLGLNTSDSYEIQEKLFQELIKNNNSIQSYILDALDLDSVNADFDKETKYINGITSDFTIISNSEITAIIECKRADINVTEYVRGIGQLFQYDYFYRKNITPKNLSTLTYNSNRFVSVLIIPSTFIKNTQLNIGRFAYPKTFKLLEINLNNNYVRQITEDELNTLANAANENLVTISQYYIRDNRLFELYICLKYLRIKGSFNNREKLNRKDLEENLRKVETINNRNWRNVFISLSLLGFINSNNQLTEIGLIMSNKDYSDFILNMYQDYLKPFIDEIMDTLTSDKSSSIKISNDEISRKLRDKHGGKDILFLTESQNRYISSWMNILRDDFGCVQFRPRNSKREILYHPKELNEHTLKNKISSNTSANKYIEKFDSLAKKGILF